MLKLIGLMILTMGAWRDIRSNASLRVVAFSRRTSDDLGGRKQMKKLTAIVVIAMMFPVTSHAADSWDRQDVMLEALYIGLHILDWGTTRDLSKRPVEDDYHEANPIFGRHPSSERVDVLMLAGLVIHPLITNYMPKRWKFFGVTCNLRRIWQNVTITSTGTCVAYNVSIGLKVNF